MSLRARPPRPGDEAAVAELQNAYDAAFGGDGAWTAADVADEWWRVPGQSPEVWVVETGGELAGCATLRRPRAGRLHASGCTHPAHAGQGVGTLLVGLTEQRAAERAGERGRVQLGARVRRGRLPAARGPRIRREPHHLRMRVDLDAAPPRAGRRRRASPSRASGPEATTPRWMRASRRRSTAPGRHQAQWRLAKVADARFDPALWIVAREGGEVCGVALCMPQTFGMGFVESLAVRAPWRRRGVGAALLGEALARLWRAGERSVGLGVDADNPAAIRLYERAGMRIAWRAVPYERELHA